MPRKNVLPLCGKPLIAWTIEAAVAASSVDRVVVSTDDPEIGAVAEKFGAGVIWRPEEISGDLASSEAALLHALDHLAEMEGYRPSHVVFLQCTSPLTIADDIDATVERLERENADTALAVTDFHYFLWRWDESDSAVGINHDKRVRPMRQQREPNYRETGAVYVMNADGFRERKHRFFGKTVMQVIPPERCLEVDEPVDFRIAEVLLRDRLQKARIEKLPAPVSAVVFDFDGVMTDNRVLVQQDGSEAVYCNRGDGWGISRLREEGIPMLVLSTEENPVVAARCQKLDIRCLQGFREKLVPLREWLHEHAIDPRHVIYLGNDENDVACLEFVGCGAVVSDAHEIAVPAADIVLESRGGKGAVREVCHLVLQRLKRSATMP
ncbi:MAG: acylneuraminate cytidylyltransferase [Planctomycetales bacterium]|nr:acylneuraminate cytidylyltransferase [Planctomycetales bacterium]